MAINSKSLCNACIHINYCSLTSNKNFIWSCSEYEEEALNNAKPEPISATDFNFTKSEKEIEIN